MKRLIAAVVIVIAVAALCSAKSYLKTTADAWEFIKHVQEEWIYQFDHSNKPCQDPAISLLSLRGDCDDFAVMIAYALQEYWNFDTFIVLIDVADEKDHAVAFMFTYESTVESLSAECRSDYPCIKWEDRMYIPIDFSRCPSWDWITSEGTIDSYEWYDLVGKPI